MGAILTLKGGRHGASALIGYVTRHDKLDKDKRYAHDLPIDNKLAQKQLQGTRNIFEKNNGVQAHHWIQSFDNSFDKNNPDDVEKAYQVGVKFVDEIAKAYPNHEIYMGTHTDSDSGYIHNHIVFGSIDTQTGKKFQSTKEVGYNLHDLNVKVLKDFGIEQPKDKVVQFEKEMFAEGKTSKRQDIKNMIKTGRKRATDFDSFQSIMAKDFNVEVYEFNKGKRIGYKWTDKEGKDFHIGAKKLGSDFEKEGLENYFSSEMVLEKQKQREKVRRIQELKRRGYDR